MSRRLGDRGWCISVADLMVLFEFFTVSKHCFTVGSQNKVGRRWHFANVAPVDSYSGALLVSARVTLRNGVTVRVR